MNTNDFFRTQTRAFATVMGYKSATRGLDKLSEGTAPYIETLPSGVVVEGDVTTSIYGVKNCAETKTFTRCKVRRVTLNGISIDLEKNEIVMGEVTVSWGGYECETDVYIDGKMQQ